MTEDFGSRLVGEDLTSERARVVNRSAKKERWESEMEHVEGTEIGWARGVQN